MLLLTFPSNRLVGPPAWTHTTEKRAILSLNSTLVFPKLILKVENPARHKVYEFGDYRVDVAHRMLYQQGIEIPMAPKAVETLLALIERRGKIVSKEELLETVWPDTVVEESNLFVYLSLLRKT